MSPEGDNRRAARPAAGASGRRPVAKRTAAKAKKAAPREPEQLLVFRVAGDPYALPLSVVREVVASAARRRLPGQTEPWVVGMASVRGELMPVVDLAVRLGHGPADAGAESMLLVVESAKQVAAVEVERVDRLVDPGPLADAPPYAGEAAAAIAEVGDELVIVLRPEALLPAA